jgi:hypothetical protein
MLQVAERPHHYVLGADYPLSSGSNQNVELFTDLVVSPVRGAARFALWEICC